jgi:sugar transferase (PEP-CTERM/EpsH1 system associated)
VRILVLTHRLPYAPNRGDRIRAHYLLRALATRHEVHLLSLAQEREEAHRAADLAGLVASVETAAIRRAPNLLRSLAALPGPQPLTHTMLYSAEFGAKLRGIVRRRRPDVVLVYCTGVAPQMFEPSLADTPCVLDMVDVDSEKWAAFARERGAWRRWIYAREARCLRAFEAAAVRRAAATTVVSDREAEMLRAIVPDAHIVVIPNGVDSDFFRPAGPPAREPHVVFCGIMNYEPNEAGAVWMAEEVWPEITARVPQARLTIVGMHPTPRVSDLRRDPSIEVTGAVPDVRPYLWRAAVSVAPLAVARGLQNKVLEALAAGVPCVVTPEVHRGLPRAARNGCRTAGDAVSFRDAVMHLLSATPERRREIAAAAGVESLRWDSQLDPILTLLDAAACPTQPVRDEELAR